MVERVHALIVRFASPIRLCSSSSSPWKYSDHVDRSTRTACDISLVKLALTLVLSGFNRVSWCEQRYLLELGWTAVNSLLQKAASADCDLDRKIIKEQLAEAVIHCIATGKFWPPGNVAVLRWPLGIPATNGCRPPLEMLPHSFL